MYISCRNACFNYLKRQKIKSIAQEAYHQQFEEGEEIILKKIIKAEVLDILVQEIELLPEKCREVFKLIYFDHKKTDEIAVELLKSSIFKKGITDALFLAFLLLLE